MEMNSEIKQKWIDALRSGNYSQGSGRLRSDQGFCCLGVLCDIYAQQNNENWDKCTYADTSQLLDYWYFGGESEFLPEFVMDWAGLKLPNPVIRVEVDNLDEGPFSFKDEIANLNDTGYNFSELSNLIEQQL